MAGPGGNKRLINEIQKLKAMETGSDPSGVKFVLEKSPLDQPAGASGSVITGRIFPQSNIYNQASFQIELKLPVDFPFKAPEARFVTPIYHPNVDDKGNLCVDVLNSTDTFKPTTPLTDVVKAITHVIDHPNIDHSLTPGEPRSHFAGEGNMTLFVA